MPQAPDGNDYVQVVVVEYDGKKEELFGIGLDGCAKITKHLLSLHALHGKDNVALVHNNRYVPIGHFGAVLAAFYSSVESFNATEKALKKVGEEIIKNEGAKVDLVIEAYKKEPSKEDLKAVAEKYGLPDSFIESVQESFKPPTAH